MPSSDCTPFCFSPIPAAAAAAAVSIPASALIIVDLDIAPVLHFLFVYSFFEGTVSTGLGFIWAMASAYRVYL